VLAQRLQACQASLLEAAVARREANSYRGVDDWNRFREIIEGSGGFVYTGWCGGESCEDRVKQETKATIRVIPMEEFRTPDAPARCLVCRDGAQHEVVWARAY
jgi:prolyl-tRNA synthetase